MALTKEFSNDEISVGIAYCLEIKKCSAYELTCFMLMKYGEERCSKVIKPHMLSKYRNRAAEIRKEHQNG